MPLLNEDPGFIHPRTHQALAPGQVRFVGEAVALVVADSRYLAEDALDLIEVDYAPEPAAVDLVAAAEPGAPLVHDDTESNVACRTADETGDIESAFAAGRLRAARGASARTRRGPADGDSGRRRPLRREPRCSSRSGTRPRRRSRPAG